MGACAAGQPVCPQVSWGTGMPVSDREYPALTGRSGTLMAQEAAAGWLGKRLRIYPP